MAALRTVTKYLDEGDSLCCWARLPLYSETIRKVRDIYEKCNAILVNEEPQHTPLTYASYLGLHYMVKGFIECARQTNTNLYHGKIGDFQKLLLKNSSWDSLTAKNRDGKTPLSYLHDLHEYDDAIFEILEGETREVADAPGATVISIDDEQQELIDYNETSMEPTTYKLSNKQKSLNKLDSGELELSLDGNTILHIAAMLGDVECVKDILERHLSILIERRNLKGETPTFVAAREGHWEIIQIIIGHLRRKQIDILKHMTRSIDNETALLTAIRNHAAVVVFFLTKEVPALANHINDFEESPLYVAALKGYDGIVGLILKKCKEIAYGGPNGKTSLHAAAFSGSTVCIKHLLKSNSGLLHAQDARGWTALHIAASLGHYGTVKYFIREYPGCQEITCSKGRNWLHVAVENEQEELIRDMFEVGISRLRNIMSEEGLLTRRLTNEKDNDGNTPIHLLVASNLEMSQIITDPKTDLTALNKEKKSPLDKIHSDKKREALDNEEFSNLLSKKSDLNVKKKHVFDVADNVVIVAALIATATFAAAFAVPGGYDGNEGSKQGMPILLRKSAFKAFFVTNALAFSCSCAVLLVHIRLLINRDPSDEADEEEEKRIGTRVFLMYVLVVIAMVTMAIAFISGVFVVLASSLGFAISLSVICIFILVFTSVFALKTCM